MSESKRDLEIAAMNQRVRAQRAEKRAEDMHHALNLYANDSVEWFFSTVEPNGEERKFGIGVAMNAPIDDQMYALAVGRKSEHRAIVFWLSSGLSEQGRVYRYVTACGLEDFKRLPNELEQAHEPGWEHLADLVRNAIAGVDAAYRDYLKRRTPENPIM